MGEGEDVDDDEDYNEDDLEEEDAYMTLGATNN